MFGYKAGNNSRLYEYFVQPAVALLYNNYSTS